MKKRDKKAQFYIMAAVVISAIIVSVALVMNVSQTREFTELYHLSEELKMESDKVLDYGVYNALEANDLNNLLKNFTKIYTTYKGEEKDLYFVFGDSQNITVAGYVGQTGTPEDLEVKIKKRTGDSFGAPLELSNVKEYASKTYSTGSEEEVVIIVGDIEYVFEIKDKEYFYFVLNKKIHDQYYVITNERKK